MPFAYSRLQWPAAFRVKVLVDHQIGSGAIALHHCSHTSASATLGRRPWPAMGTVASAGRRCRKTGAKSPFIGMPPGSRDACATLNG